MINNKIHSYLGFAQKSRNAILGYDNLISTKKKCFVILVDESGSDRLKRNIEILAKENIPFFIVPNLEELTNRNGCKVIGVSEPNLAKVIIEQLRGSRV